MAEAPALGLLAQFPSPERLVAAARAAKAEGLLGIDAFTPFPVDELNEVLGIEDHRIGWTGVIGGTFGLVGAYALQIGTNGNYPIWIGGRPLVAPQAFALIGFELLVLCAVGFMVAAFFVFNRLPRYHQPLFWVKRFERATRDGFFLYVPTPDEEALRQRRAWLEAREPLSIDAVPR